MRPGVIRHSGVTFIGLSESVYYREMPSQSEETGSTQWDAQRLAGDPHKVADKDRRVRQMFSAIAHAYDLNNRIHSMGLDQWWRKAAVAACQPVSGCDVLDVACGTGDLTLAFERAGSKSVVGLDYTPAMLERAKLKLAKTGELGSRVQFIEGDAMRLPFPDRSFDIVSIAFGIRNVANEKLAISEFRRVLRPGGRLAVLEFSQPQSKLVRAVHGFYTRRVMPLTASLLARDHSGAYRYLPRSVETFLTPGQLAQEMQRVGFDRTEHHPMTLGTCTLTIGRLN